jgi:hypothetical protein
MPVSLTVWQQRPNQESQEAPMRIDEFLEEHALLVRGWRHLKEFRSSSTCNNIED